MDIKENNNLDNKIRCIKIKVREDTEIAENRPPDGFSANFLNNVAEVYEGNGAELTELFLEDKRRRNNYEAKAILRLLKIFIECNLNDRIICGMMIKTLESMFSKEEI